VGYSNTTFETGGVLSLKELKDNRKEAGPAAVRAAKLEKMNKELAAERSGAK
jgi:hypothetical protein